MHFNRSSYFGYGFVSKAGIVWYLLGSFSDVKVDQNVTEFVVQGLLSFIGTSDVNHHSYLLHLEVVNLLLVAMSSQLHSGPSPGPKDIHPFIDAAMMQESALVGPFVRRLLLSYIARLPVPSNAAYYSSISKESQPGVLRKVGSAAGMIDWLTDAFLSFV
eukprot:Gb_15047 [translate_table: standard]